MTPENQLAADWMALSKERAPIPASLGRHALSWLSSADLLAHDDASAVHLRQIMAVLEKNPDWHFFTSIPKPAPCIEQMLSERRDKIAYVAQELIYRDAIREAMIARFGSDTAPIQLGDRQQHLGIRLSTEITDGGLNFSLIDTYREFELGYVALDYLNADMIIVESMQEHAEVIPTFDDAIRVSRSRNGETSYRHRIANDQHAIRRWIARNEGSHGHFLDDGTKTDNPGVEEALMGGVVKMLQELGFVHENTQIFIPHPSTSRWGRYAYREGNLGVAYAAWKQVQPMLDKNPTLRKQVEEIIEVGSSYITDTDRRTTAGTPLHPAHLLYRVIRGLINDSSPFPSIITDKGEIDIYHFYLNTLIASLSSENQEKVRRVMELYDGEYSSGRGRLSLDLLLHLITQLTPAYLRQFHVYNSAFSNVAGQTVSENGRFITTDGILRKQFVQRISFN